MPTIVCQPWLESERGWGQRPDGFSLHKSHADLISYCREYESQLPDEVPDEYSRVDGLPYLIDVDENHDVYKQLVNSKNGIRVYKNPFVSH